MDDASTIINAAARRSRIEVKGSERDRPRNPFRQIEVVELAVPPCTFACSKNHRCYPEGAELLVHPRQVAAHRQIYPGSRVLRHIKRTIAKPARGTAMVPRGHRDPREFLGGKQVHS